MLIIAHYNILVPEKFWPICNEALQQLPPSLKVYSMFPSKDMKTNICVWDAPSVHELQAFIDDTVGDTSKNYCYEVNTREAMGLPPEPAAESEN